MRYLSSISFTVQYLGPRGGMSIRTISQHVSLSDCTCCSWASLLELEPFVFAGVAIKHSSQRCGVVLDRVSVQGGIGTAGQQEGRRLVQVLQTLVVVQSHSDTH